MRIFRKVRKNQGLMLLLLKSLYEIMETLISICTVINQNKQAFPVPARRYMPDHIASLMALSGEIGEEIKAQLQEGKN